MATVKSPPMVQQPAKPDAATKEPTHSRIEERAYYRYLERGCVDGLDLDDWLAAEADLCPGEPRPPSAFNAKDSES
jgi:hypothetical protein